jgi:hypothetical protein
LFPEPPVRVIMKSLTESRVLQYLHHTGYYTLQFEGGDFAGQAKTKSLQGFITTLFGGPTARAANYQYGLVSK